MSKYFTEDESRTWAPFIMSTLHLLATLDAELMTAFDLLHLDYGLLMLLSQAENHARRMTELAAVFGLDPSNITYRVKRMEARGLVERRSSADDGRFVYAYLTEAGLTLLRKAQVFHVARVRGHFLDHLTPQQAKMIAEVFSELWSRQQAEAPETAGESPEDE